MKKVCTYEDFSIYMDGDKYYVMQEVELVEQVRITNQSELELMDGCSKPFDFGGELDDEPTYCYWITV